MPTTDNNQTITMNPRREIDDLIGNPPGCLLKSGITIVALVIVTILTMSAFISYPVKIVAIGEMTGDYPPIEHVNKVAGVIDKIYVKDGESVKKGDKIAYLQNSMNRNHLRSITHFIQQYQTVGHIADYANIYIPKNLQLGDLTADYARLQLLFEEFQSTLRQSGVYQQTKTLEIEIQKTRQLACTLEKEKKYAEEELRLIEKDLGRDTYLLEEGAISQLEKEESEGALLRYQKQYNNLDIGIIQNTIKEEQLRLQIQQLAEERTQQLNNYRFNIQEVINRINQQIKQWEEQHYILAEVSGKIVLQPNITQDIFAKPNTPLFSIISDKQQDKKYAKVITPVQGIGKITEGDKALLKLEGYPYKEYGVIISEVYHIAPLPNKDQEGNKNYEIKIPLSDTLMTNYKKIIEYKPQSALTAEIITKDKSILERITEQLLDLITDR